MVTMKTPTKVEPDRVLVDIDWKILRILLVHRWFFIGLGKAHFRLDWSPLFHVQTGWNCGFWYTGALLSYSRRVGFKLLRKYEWDDV